jgi:hypothetical protein
MPARNFIPSIAAAILAIESFAIWAAFSAVPFITGRPGIREAWDTSAYWRAGVPLLVVSVALAGFLSRDKPMALAAWTVAGHFLGILLIAKPGSDLGLLPLALVFIGAPAFGIFTGVAWLAGRLRRRPPSAASSD